MASVPLTDSRAPALPQLLREAGSLLAFRWKRWTPLTRPVAARAKGQSVLVIPGFLASDTSTKLLREALESAGYRAHGWKKGLNLGARPDVFDHLEARLDRVARHGGKVALVGWSLGGLYARELAKRQPDKVSRVITLGSPFSGDLRANHGWWLYEMLAGHKIDHHPLIASLTDKPPVPTTAFWSRQDGIVAPASARGRDGECDEAIELDCTHMGFMSAPCAIRAVLEKLAE